MDIILASTCLSNEYELLSQGVGSPDTWIIEL